MNYDFSKLPVDLVLNILNIVILFVIVRFLVYKPVKNFIDSRAERVNKAAEEAENKSKAADELSAKLEAQLADAEHEAEAIKNEAALAAKNRADEVIADAKAQADKIIADAKERAENEKKEILSSVRDEIAAGAEAIAGRILERKVSDEDTRRIAEEFFREAAQNGGDAV